MENKKAKYFCENCGAEVLSKARFCPHCGKFFSAVRCPNCSFTGSVTEFRNGCPVCHYTEDKGDSRSAPKKTETADGLKHKLSRKSKKKIREAFVEYDKKTSSPSSDTPVWLLVVCLLILVAAIVGMFTFFRK